MKVLNLISRLAIVPYVSSRRGAVDLSPKNLLTYCIMSTGAHRTSWKKWKQYNRFGFILYINIYF